MCGFSVAGWLTLAALLLLTRSDFSTVSQRPALRLGFDIETFTLLAPTIASIAALTFALALTLTIPALVLQYFAIKRLEKIYYVHFHMPKTQVFILKWIPVTLLLAIHFCYFFVCLLIEPRSTNLFVSRSKTLSRFLTDFSSQFQSKKWEIKGLKSISTPEKKQLVFFYPASLAKNLDKYPEIHELLSHKKYVMMPHWSTGAHILRSLHAVAFLNRSEWQNTGASLQEETFKRPADELKKKQNTLVILGQREALLQSRINLNTKNNAKFKQEIRGFIARKRLYSSQLQLLPFSHFLASQRERHFAFFNNRDDDQLRRLIEALPLLQNTTNTIAVQLDELERVEEEVKHPLDGLRWDSRSLEKADAVVADIFWQNLALFLKHLKKQFPQLVVKVFPYRDEHPAFTSLNAAPLLQNIPLDDLESSCELIPFLTDKHVAFQELKSHFFWNHFMGVMSDFETEARELAATMSHNTPEALQCGNRFFLFHAAPERISLIDDLIFQGQTLAQEGQKSPKKKGLRDLPPSPPRLVPESLLLTPQGHVVKADLGSAESRAWEVIFLQHLQKYLETTLR